MAQQDQIHTLKELNVTAAPWNPTMPPSPPASTYAVADQSERSSPSPTAHTHPVGAGPPSPHYVGGIDIPKASPWSQFSPSIWNDATALSSPDYHLPRTPRPSFSTESQHSNPVFLSDDQLWSKHVLAATQEDEIGTELKQHQQRVRSKSSTAAFGMVMESPTSPMLEPIGQSIWGRPPEAPQRRRSSTSVGWHPMATTRSPPNINTFYNTPSIMNQPPLSSTLPRSDHWSQRSSFNEYTPMPPPYRRHSLATTPSMFPRHTSQNNYQLNDLLDKVHLDEQNNAGLTPDVLDTIQGYFENDRQRTQIFNDMGKGISLDQVPAAGAMYMVEFKAGRSDLYYVADKSTCSVKQGDLVIVEADRGKDLGKIILEDLTPEYVETLALQKEQQQQQQDGLGEDGQDSKELRPKQIYRKAVPAEVAMLLAKRQDEIKAVMVCQTKTRQKRLPMEVVDAEFQWDRRKLTFYFVAERRIDFRELVRDLFKTYKTRIWMCAVNPSANSN
ncbi:unnamed protein product [Umbelopsis sp. WA50703]